MIAPDPCTCKTSSSRCKLACRAGISTFLGATKKKWQISDARVGSASSNINYDKHQLYIQQNHTKSAQKLQQILASASVACPLAWHDRSKVTYPIHLMPHMVIKLHLSLGKVAKPQMLVDWRHVLHRKISNSTVCCIWFPQFHWSHPLLAYEK